MIPNSTGLKTVLKSFPEPQMIES